MVVPLSPTELQQKVGSAGACAGPERTRHARFNRTTQQASAALVLHS